MEYIRIAVLLSAGILLSERFSPSFTVIFIISLIMVLTIKAIFKHRFNVKILIMALIFILGTVICSWAKSDASRDLYEYTGRYITAEGRISEIPSKKDGNVQYTVDVRNVKWKNEQKKVRAKILLTAGKGFEYGDSIIFEGFLDTLPQKMNENGFDYSLYYKSKHIFSKIYSSNVSLSQNEFHDYSPYALGNYVRNFVSKIIDKNYKGDYAAIMKSILTGNKKEFSDDFSKVLTRTGTMRFFYPAFLHVSLFTTLLAFLLSAFNRRGRDIMTVFLLIIYAMFNFSGAVFVKLCLMMSLLILFRMRFGYIYFLDIIGLTAIVMGLVNPLIFFNAGFVMSMLSTVLIYYFFDSVEKRLNFIKVKYIRRMLAIGIICTIGLMPLSAYYFHGITLMQSVASIIIIPCAAAILILSPVLIIMFCMFGSAPVISQAVSSILFILKRIPYLLDKLGFTQTTLPKPDILFLIIYMLVIVALVKYIKHKKRDMLIALFAAAALVVPLTVQQAMRLDDTEICFINVGQGDGALIRAPYRYNILIDGGGGNAYADYNPGETLFLEYLMSEGITRIDSAFVSHYHKDHVQGIIAAIENIRVKNLFLPDNMERSEWRIKLEKAAHEHNTAIHYISEETLLTYNNGMTLRIIPPAKKAAVSDNENDTSYVCRIEYGDFSAIFTGDMTTFAEKCLIETNKAEEADLLKVAHHGSKTSTSEEWLDKINPKYSVISVGEKNTYALPNKEVTERLKNTVLYRTDLDGDIRFTAEKSGKVKIDTRR